MAHSAVVLLRALLPLCACLLAGCSVFPDSPPQVGTPAQDSGPDSDAEIPDAADESDVSLEADAPDEADAADDTDSSEDVAEGGDADDAADALESSDAPPDAPDHCFDDAVNNGETDLNCGGEECPPCKKSQSCVNHSDCESGTCNPGNKCA